MQFRNVIPGELGVNSERQKVILNSIPGSDSESTFYSFDIQKRFRIHFWSARDAPKCFSFAIRRFLEDPGRPGGDPGWTFGALGASKK